MTTDNELLADLRQAISSRSVITEDFRTQVNSQIQAYIVACSISRMANKQRAAAWSVKAFDRGRNLQKALERIRGR